MKTNYCAHKILRSYVMFVYLAIPFQNNLFTSVSNSYTEISIFACSEALLRSFHSIDYQQVFEMSRRDNIANSVNRETFILSIKDC